MWIDGYEVSIMEFFEWKNFALIKLSLLTVLSSEFKRETQTKTFTELINFN